MAHIFKRQYERAGRWVTGRETLNGVEYLYWYSVQVGGMPKSI